MSEPLENLKLILTSPRPRAPSTLTSYLSVANNFLAWLGDRLPPDEMDLRRYFMHRRKEKISDSTLRTAFAVLEKLYKANHWDWPLVKGDRPELSSEANTPAFTRGEVEQLVLKRELYSKGECFYLAIATIYAPRRVELARIEKRDIKGHTIYIDTAKKGEKRTHLIPDEIMPYIEAYHPKEHNVASLSAMFQSICNKGLEEMRKGYGWHSFRRTLDTLLISALAKADEDITYVGYFPRWSRREFGQKFAGTRMAGVYARPEVLSSEPFHIDQVVFKVHPFLSLWADKRQP